MQIIVFYKNNTYEIFFLEETTEYLDIIIKDYLGLDLSTIKKYFRIENPLTLEYADCYLLENNELKINQEEINKRKNETLPRNNLDTKKHQPGDFFH